jgi:hypothetical protein
LARCYCSSSSTPSTLLQPGAPVARHRSRARSQNAARARLFCSPTAQELRSTKDQVSLPRRCS